MKTRKYFVTAVSFGPARVFGAAFIRARSKDAAAKRMLNLFFERFPLALEKRRSIGMDIERA